PWLISVRAADGALAAVAGLKPAALGPLFLEQYLDGPVEEAIAAAAGEPVARGSVVEVGNLAAAHAGGARAVIVAVTALLHQARATWVCFTGGPVLHNAFRRLGMAPLPLAPARPEALGAAAARWGRYYEQRPWVFAGRVAEGYACLQRWLTAEQLWEAARGTANPVLRRAA
ncbi:MAG: thermostable hemolysin, partial [Nitrospirae bacterium]